MPGVVKLTQSRQSLLTDPEPSTSTSKNTIIDVTSDSDDVDDVHLPWKSETKNKRTNAAEPAPVKKRARRKEGNENNLVEVIAEMPNMQLKTMEAYQGRSE